MQGKMSEKKIHARKNPKKKIHAQDGPYFDIKPELYFLLEKCFKMHQMALECVQIFKIFPGDDAPGLPYGNGPPAHLNTAGAPNSKQNHRSKQKPTGVLALRLA